jgi:hypothetical protein
MYVPSRWLDNVPCARAVLMKANSSQTNVHNPRHRHICPSIAGAQPYSHNPGSQRH